MKGAIRVPVTGASLLQSLHLYDDNYHRIIGVRVDNRTFDNIELIISGDEFPVVEYPNQPIEVIPIITHEFEKFTVDWNLPKDTK